MTNQFPNQSPFSSPSPFSSSNQDNLGSPTFAQASGYQPNDPNRPAQTNSTLFSQQVPSSAFKTTKASSLGKWLGILAGVGLLAGGGLFWGQQQGYIPATNNFAAFQWLPLSQAMFSNGAGLARPDAQALYQQSLLALKNKQYQTALDGFTKLEKAYPGLQELILLHQAEAYAAIGEESKAQTSLKTLIQRYPKHPIRLKALYLLGQSHIRATEPDAAKLVFTGLLQSVPTTQYGIGSLYYLGLLSQKQNPQASKDYWLSYLRQCPDCRFSGDSAEALDKLWPAPTAEGHQWIGIGLATSQRKWPTALAHLQKAPFDSSWFYLAKAYNQTHQADKAADAYVRGLAFSNNGKQTQDTIDWLVKSAPAPRLPRLETLTSTLIPTQGDYLLWQLAQAKPESANSYYQEILRRYPQGDYAPESAWNLYWPLYASGQYQAFIDKASTHVQTYHYARSAPKALFWIGKSQEKLNSPDSAKQTYLKVIEEYPNQYYAFRAKGRLNVVEKQQADPGWITRVVPYQPGFSLQQIQILPPKNQFSALYLARQQNTVDANRVYAAMEELQKIGAADDVLLLSDESLEKTPAAITSWAYLQNNERPKGLRAIRDDLQERLKQSPHHHPTPDERKLLYPVYFAPAIAQASRQNSVDPYIIQGLMREESYFNEFATSSSDARGLMQLLPSTAGDVANWEGIGNFQVMSLFDPATNIRLGSRYLKFLQEQFLAHPDNLRFMAVVGSYNGGPNAMKRWIAANPNFTKDPDLFVEQIPYEQTRDYIKKVFGSAWNYQDIYGP